VSDQRTDEQIDILASVAEESAKRHFDRANAYEASAAKTLFLANAGAIVALLTFVGNSNADVSAEKLFFAFICFGVGIGAVMMLQTIQYSRYENLAQFEQIVAQRIRLRGYKNIENLPEIDNSSLGKSKFAFHLAIWLTSVASTAFLAGPFTALKAIT